MRTEQVSSKDDYLRLIDLIRRDKIRLLVHNRYKGIRKSVIYGRCGTSFKYFEEAYETGKVILQFDEFGPRDGFPTPWQEVLADYSGQEKEIQWCKTCKYFKTVEEYEDELWLSEKMVLDSNIPCKKFDNTQDVWIEYFNLPAGKRTLYPKRCPKWAKRDKPSAPNVGDESMSIDSFKERINNQEDLLFGITLFYQGIVQMWVADEAMLEMNRESYEQTSKRMNEAIKRAKHLLDQVQENSSKLSLLQEFEFPPTIEEMAKRSKILIEAYDDLFSGRPRETPLSEKENLQLMKVVSNRL